MSNPALKNLGCSFVQVAAAMAAFQKTGVSAAEFTNFQQVNMRKILTLENGQKRAKIYKSDGEYVVRFYEHAVYQSEADYFTDNREDAVNTAEIQIGLRSLQPL